MKNRRLCRHIAIMALAVMPATACAGGGLGGLGDILAGAVGGQPAGAQQGQISAEVRSVDTNARSITVVTADGQTGAVRYDQNTTVVYKQQQHPVTALERGDLVVLTVTQDAQGNVMVSRVDVTQSVRERTGTTGTSQVAQYNGRITAIDHDRGTLTLQVTSGNLLVQMPYNPPRATLDYFHRLRVGDNVRLEATAVGTNRIEIYRFL